MSEIWGVCLITASNVTVTLLLLSCLRRSHDGELVGNKLHSNFR